MPKQSDVFISHLINIYIALMLNKKFGYLRHCTHKINTARYMLLIT